MSKVTRSGKKVSEISAKVHRRTVTWPDRSQGGGILSDGKLKKTTLATISSTSKTLNRALKRLADK